MLKRVTKRKSDLEYCWEMFLHDGEDVTEHGHSQGVGQETEKEYRKESSKMCLSRTYLQGTGFSIQLGLTSFLYHLSIVMT